MSARFMLGVVFVLISRWAGAGLPPEAQAAGPETTFTATSANVNDAGRTRNCNRLRLHDYRIAARLQRIWRGQGVDQHQSRPRRGRKDDCTGELRSGSCSAEERQALKDRHYSAELTTPAFGHPSSARRGIFSPS